MCKINSFLFIFLLVAKGARTQDTLKIDIRQADSIFISANFNLLASSMNIEAQKALVLQAKLYPNPVLGADINAYNPDNKKLFQAGKAGQKAFQLEQLILMGGKRKVEIEMARANVRIAELEFLALVRQLKFRLHTGLFAIGQQQLLLARYDSQLSLLNTLLLAYQAQADKGNVALKDVVRLKGAYLKLNNDRSELLKDYSETQTNLQTLLASVSIIKFQFTEKEIEKYLAFKALEEIRTGTLLNRPELLLLQQDRELASQLLHYQKKLAVPDLTVIASYDQRGGAFNNQLNAGISVPLPFWNRNQGNIKSSAFRLKEAGYNLEAGQTEILSSLQNAYVFHKQTVAEYQKATALYNEEFEVTVKGMTENFQKQNVSIIEFIDFFEAYNEALSELTRVKIQLVTSGEQLNLLAGKDIY